VLSYALNLLGVASWVTAAAETFADRPVLFLFAIGLLMLVLGTFLVETAVQKSATVAA
jgi:TRAP-type C4-dicarboxylate transport system permease large subunit